MRILGRGFGPPIYVDRHRGYWGYPHHHDTPASLIGGVIGGVIGSYLRPQPPAVIVPDPDPSVPDDESFRAAMTYVAKVPEGGVVQLRTDEFRSLVDRNMIEYRDAAGGNKIPFVLNRQIAVVDT